MTYIMENLIASAIDLVEMIADMETGTTLDDVKATAEAREMLASIVALIAKGA